MSAQIDNMRGRHAALSFLIAVGPTSLFLIVKEKTAKIFPCQLVLIFASAMASNAILTRIGIA